MMDTKLETCSLCNKTSILMESHLIPRFVYEWIKNTSKTPYIRSSENINQRLQDGPKFYLLCEECEQFLSKLEDEFAKNFFKKIANYRNQSTTLMVTENMKTLILSVFWRCLIKYKDNENDRTNEDTEKLLLLIEDLKRQINTKCDSKIYFLPFYGKEPYYDIPQEYIYLLERCIQLADARFLDEPHRWYVVLKLPFMYFYIFSDGFSDAEISGGTEFTIGNIEIDKINTLPQILRAHIDKDYREFLKSKKDMSPTQIEKISRDMMKSKSNTGSDKSLYRSLRNKKGVYIIDI